MVDSSRVRVGFGRASLWGSWHEVRPLADQIEVRALVAEDDGGPAAVLAADVCGMWPRTCRALRHQVAEALATAPDRVGIFCTQNHGAPMEGPQVYDLDHWRRAFVDAARQARAAAQPALMACIEVTPAPAAVFRRRCPVEGLGEFTFYYGFEPTPEGNAGCARLLGLALRGLACGQHQVVRHLPGPRPEDWPAADLEWCAPPPDVCLPGAADGLLQGVLFRTSAGEPIGTVARYAAHPVTANLAGGPCSGDYPAWVRARLEERLGGGALFLTGPCGDQAPLVDRKRVELARALGTRLADALAAGARSADWRPLGRLRAITQVVSLPLRKDYPSSVTAAARDRAQARQASGDARSLAERKRLAELIERLDYTVDGHHYSWCGFRPEEAGTSVQHPLFGLGLDEVRLIGLPGEPFGAYGTHLRRACAPGPVLVVEECNGYLSYIPAAADLPNGGYGPAAAILAPEAEQALLHAGRTLAEALARD